MKIYNHIDILANESPAIAHKQYFVAYEDMQRVMLEAIAHLQAHRILSDHDNHDKRVANAIAVLKDALELNHG